MPVDPLPGATATPPYGIAPYVEQAWQRIERQFRGEARDAATRGEAFVVGVFGEWGSGKSTVLGAIGAKYDNVPRALSADPTGAVIRPEVTLRVDFNAWRYEREEHLLVPLLKTVQRTLDAYVEALSRLEVKEQGVAGAAEAAGVKLVKTSTWQWLSRRATLLGACTIALTRMVKLKAGVPGLGEVELDPNAALEAMQKQVDRARALEEKAAAPNKPPVTLESFYYDLFGHLHKLTRGLDDQDQGRLNFVFLIDDLDRCLPEKAVEMLEAIKLFLDVEGCAFVLALDDEVIERGIAYRYRNYLDPALQAAGVAALAPPITGHEYLEKIVQLPFRLPRWSKREVREFVTTRFAESLDRWAGAPGDPLVSATPPATPNRWLVDLIVDAVPPMPRNLVRAIELLDFMRSVAIERKLGERLQAYPVAQMTLLQLFAPDCFRFLRRGHAEGWKTFERRLRKDNREFSDATPILEDMLKRQPAVSSETFFDWWIELCTKRLVETADPYVGRTERPLALRLNAARNNRNGFDPRNLMLTQVEVDASLEPYFSLFAEVTTPAPAASAPVPPVAAPVAAPAVEPRPTRPTEPAGAVSAPPASGPTVVVAHPPTVPTAAPRDRESFVRQLLTRSPDAWRNAITREEQLAGHVLDDATVEALLEQAGDAPREVAWLETLAPRLGEMQLRRLVRETRCLERWAEAAGLLAGAPVASGGTAARIEFARALEQVCRHLNPPHRPLPTALLPAELGIAELALRDDDPLLAYRYRRGLELPGPVRPREATGRLWAAEPGQLSPASVVAELEPGSVATGDLFGTVRIYTRASRARWECVATLHPHAVGVNAIAPLRSGGCVSVAGDGSIAVCTRDGSGQWDCREPTPPAVGPARDGGLNAVCQLADDVVIAGGVSGNMTELTMLPSGEWAARLVGGGGNSIVALAPCGPHGWCEVRYGGVAATGERAADGSSWSTRPVASPPEAGPPTDVVAWGDGVVMATEFGWAVPVALPAPFPPLSTSVAMQPQQLSTSPLRLLRRLADGGLATLSDGGQLRLWALNGSRFERRADLDTGTDTPQCFAPLCDGRVAYADNRGLQVAAPDASGVWRQDEELSANLPGIGLLAALAPDLVAYVERGTRLVLLRIKPAGVQVESMRSESAPIRALAAIDPDTLAYSLGDAALRVLRRADAETWGQPQLMSMQGPVERLAGVGGHLLALVGGVPMAFMRQSEGLLPVPLPPGAPTGITAIAIDPQGHVVVAAAGGVVAVAGAGETEWSKMPLGPTQRSFQALHWVAPGEVLLVEANGAMWRVMDRPWQESPVAPPLSVYPPVSLVAVLPDLGIAVVSGGHQVHLDSGWMSSAVRGDVRALAAAGQTLFVGADALYTVDLRPARPGAKPSLRRIVVDDELALDATLDDLGSVASLLLRRRRGQTPWNLQSAGGRPLPDDPLLHACVALQANDGSLAELSEGSNYSFNADRTVLRAESV